MPDSLNEKYKNVLLIGIIKYNINHNPDLGKNNAFYFTPLHILKDDGTFVEIPESECLDDLPNIGSIEIRLASSETIDAPAFIKTFGNIVCLIIRQDPLYNPAAKNNVFFITDYRVNDHSKCTISSLYNDSRKVKYIPQIFEVVETSQNSRRVLSDLRIPVPYSYDIGPITQRIMVKTATSLIGPFNASVNLSNYSITLIPEESNSFRVGIYDLNKYESKIAYLNNYIINDLNASYSIISEQVLGSPDESYDCISNEKLIDLFFSSEKKFHSTLTRSERGQLKDLFNKLPKPEQVLIDPERIERVNRLFQEGSMFLESNRNLMSNLLKNNKELLSFCLSNLKDSDPELLKELTKDLIPQLPQQSESAAVDVQKQEQAPVQEKDKESAEEKVLIPKDHGVSIHPENLKNLVSSLQRCVSNMTAHTERLMKLNQSILESVNGEEKADIVSIAVNPYIHEEEYLRTQQDMESFLSIISGLPEICPKDARHIQSKLQDMIQELKDDIFNIKSLPKPSDIIVSDFSYLGEDCSIVTENRPLGEIISNPEIITSFITGPFAQCLNESFSKTDGAGHNIINLRSMEQSLKDGIEDLNKEREAVESSLKEVGVEFEKLMERYKEPYSAIADFINISKMLSLIPQQITHAVITEGPAIPAVAYSSEKHSESVSHSEEQDAVAQIQPPALNFDTSLLAAESRFNNRESVINAVQKFFIDQAHRKISRDDIINCLICISQGFITTFAGEPGSGKTSLCYLLSAALGLIRTDESNRFSEISVERGWTSLYDFIGSYNPLTHKIEKSNAAIYDAFELLDREARALQSGEMQKENTAPYFILLDEANLSPIEHYWAAFFGKCDNVFKHRNSITLGGDVNLLLPEHLRFLATINFDRTTEELSDRFIDRSWIIMLNQDTADDNFINSVSDPESASEVVPFSILKKYFTPNDASAELPDELLQVLQRITDCFKEAGRPVQPRSKKMICNYCTVACECIGQTSGRKGNPFKALDYAVAQKLLPSVNGEGSKYSNLLTSLTEICRENDMRLCLYHLQRMQSNGDNDIGDRYQFFSR